MRINIRSEARFEKANWFIILLLTWADANAYASATSKNQLAVRKSAAVCRTWNYVTKQNHS